MVVLLLLNDENIIGKDSSILSHLWVCVFSVSRTPNVCCRTLNTQQLVPSFPEGFPRRGRGGKSREAQQGGSRGQAQRGEHGRGCGPGGCGGGQTTSGTFVVNDVGTGIFLCSWTS